MTRTKMMKPSWVVRGLGAAVALPALFVRALVHADEAAALEPVTDRSAYPVGDRECAGRTADKTTVRGLAPILVSCGRRLLRPWLLLARRGIRSDSRTSSRVGDHLGAPVRVW